MKLKRTLATLLSIILMLSLAVGCSAPASESEDASAVTSTEASADDAGDDADAAMSSVTLTIMAAQDQIKDVEQNILAPMFEEETGIKIDFQITPSDQFDNLLATKLDTDAAADIFLAQSGALTMEGRYNPAENCVDLSDMAWVQNYKDTTKAASSLDGKVYAQTIWNVEGGSHVVIYNKKIYEDLGLSVPTTFDEFTANAEAIKAAGITPVYEAVVDSWKPTVSYIESFIKIEQDNPGTFEALNNNEIKMVDVPGAVELTEQFKMVGQMYSGDTYMSNEYVNAGISMATGEYAMVISPSSLIGEIAANYPDEMYGSADDYGLFVYPYMDNQLYNVNPQGPSRFIFSGSEYVEEAKMYLEFMAREDVLAIMVENEPAFWDLPYTNVVPAPQVYDEARIADYPESATVMQAAVSYIDPQWMDISSDIQSLYLDQMTAEELLANIDERRAIQAEQAGDENWQ